MEYLPEEIVLMIGQYLTGQELSACCSVSRAWRKVFNIDVFWRQRCDTELADHLRHTECVVEPGFHSPEKEDSGLSPVCEWRLSYMRQVHLQNNWRLCRYREFKIDNLDRCLEILSIIYYKNDFLVVMYSQNQEGLRIVMEKMQLWNIKDKPMLLSECDVGHLPQALNKCYYDELYVYKEQVILRTDDLVQIFIISNLKLKFRCAFQVREAGLLPDITELGNAGDGEVKALFESVLLGPTLLAIQQKLCYTGEPLLGRKLHVWNIERGEKLKEELYQDFIFVMIYGSNHSDGKEAIVVVKQPNTKVSRIVIYNTNRLEFIDFSITYHDYNQILNCVLVNNCIAVDTRDCLNIYNLATNQLVKSIPQSGDCHLYNFGDNLAFSDNGELKILSLKTLDVHELLEKPVSVFEVLCKRLIVFLFSEDCINQDVSHFLTLEQCKSISSVRPYYIPFRCGVEGCTNTFGTKFLLCNDTDSSRPNIVVLHYW